MKLSIALIIAAANAEVPDDTWISGGVAVGDNPQISRTAVRTEGERRYDDLYAIAEKIFKLNGYTGRNKFDERKYWAYGCHCLILGDRPMSDMGKGRPVDSLDNRCKAYKDCQKCVRDVHGDECIGEFVRYTWKYSKRQETFVPRDDVGTCERDLYECDYQFAQDTFDNKDVYNEDNHAFYSTTGFDAELDEFCPSGGTTPVLHQCCGGGNKPYLWINTNNQMCCANGNAISYGDQC